MNLSRRRSMESAIRSDLAHPGPISHAPTCECGCGRAVDHGFIIHKGMVFREDCYEAMDEKCWYCGGPVKDGNLCSDDCLVAWENRGQEEDEADLNYRIKIGD